MTKVDPYLQDTFSSHAAEAARSANESTSIKLPMLVRIRGSQGFQPPDGFTIQAQIGTVISGRGTLEALNALEGDSNVVAIEASRDAGVEECGRSIPFVRANKVHGHASAELGEHALLAVIDTGIDLLHAAFLDDAGNSRILEIWDQTDNAGPPPSARYPNLSASYGTVHDATAIATYVTSGTLPPSLGPPSTGKSDHRAHGTHVASIAAGRAVGHFQ